MVSAGAEGAQHRTPAEEAHRARERHTATATEEEAADAQGPQVRLLLLSPATFVYRRTVDHNLLWLLLAVFNGWALRESTSSVGVALNVVGFIAVGANILMGSVRRGSTVELG